MSVVAADEDRPRSDGEDAREASCVDSHEEEDPKEEDACLKKEAGPAEAAPAPEGPPRLWGVPLKWISLVSLTLQTTAQVLLIRWARARAGPAAYLSSTVVFFVEVVKTLSSVALLAVELGSAREAGRAIYKHFASNPWEALKGAVPALIYTVQNNLMFYSLDKLSAPVQQVLYQMKILTTAGMSVLMLGKALGPTKWASCFMLAVGVAMVQWPRHQAVGSDALSPVTAAQGGRGLIDSDQAMGFLAVLCACVTSGFAAVYIQRMLQQSTCSVWMRNVQFGFFGSVMSLLVAFGQDGARILAAGFLQGYSYRVVMVIAMNAFGGLLCAVMLKYAGATLGCFSTACSIILTCTLSWALLRDFEPDALFVAGALLAIGASLLYALGLPAWVQSLSTEKQEAAAAPAAARAPRAAEKV